MHKKGHTYLLQILWCLEQNFTSRGPSKIFQGLKGDILHFFSINAFGDMARIKFLYLTVLYSNFEISHKSKKLGK